jgi:hypothetical protein
MNWTCTFRANEDSRLVDLKAFLASFSLRIFDATRLVWTGPVSYFPGWSGGIGGPHPPLVLEANGRLAAELCNDRTPNIEVRSPFFVDDPLHVELWADNGEVELVVLRQAFFPHESVSRAHETFRAFHPWVK